MAPTTTIELEDRPALQTLKLLHRLEELDEVQSVYSNVNFSSDIMEKFEEQT